MWSDMGRETWLKILSKRWKSFPTGSIEIDGYSSNELGYPDRWVDRGRLTTQPIWLGRRLDEAGQSHRRDY
jgi:hypothetical protein